MLQCRGPLFKSTHTSLIPIGLDDLRVNFGNNDDHNEIAYAHDMRVPYEE